MGYKDPEKQKEYLHQHYLDNKEKYQQTADQTRRRRRKWLQELKKTMECSACGIKDFRVLEFHHPEVRNGKEPNISRLCGTNGKKKILEAISKCIVLCCNCHKIEHWDENEQNYSRLHEGP